MAELYLVTGAAGHLGSTVVHSLLERGARVRALLLPHEPNPPAGAKIYYGDVRNRESLRPFFEDAEHATVIHCAGIVTIATNRDPLVRQVNVEGVRNIIAMCKEHRCRLLHVSSVHAIPERPKGETITEVTRFNPKKVTGYYAETKAEATQLVLDAVKDGLDALVVHPSGICGPGDNGRGHLTALVSDFCTKRLTCGITGGYDFVDVRDVAEGILLAVDKGRAGECYILSNRWLSVRELLHMLHEITGIREIKRFLPTGFIRMMALPAEGWYALRHKPPLFTRYSLYTLSSNALFSHDKATKELSYHPRDFRETLRDTVAWLRDKGRI